MGHIMPFVPRVLRGYPASADALEPPELILLSSVRRWVAAVRRAADPAPILSQAMAANGVTAAAMSIDMFMNIVARTAWRPVEVRCPYCMRVAADEQVMLHAARFAQGRDIRMAEETLRAGLLSPVGASFAMGPLKGLGRIFAVAGLLLPSRSLSASVNAPVEGVEPWLPDVPGILH